MLEVFYLSLETGGEEEHRRNKRSFSFVGTYSISGWGGVDIELCFRFCQLLFRKFIWS